MPARRRLTTAGEGLDPLAHGVQGDAGRPEDLRGRAAVLPEQARQHVLGTDVVVVQLPGLFLGEDNGSMGLVSEPFEHDITPVSAAPPTTQCAPAGLIPGEHGTRRS